MGFGSMIHRSVTGEVRKQDFIRVEDYIEGGKLIMNDDGTCDVLGTVDVSGIGLKSLTQLTPRIKRVSENFLCNNNKLINLNGSPEEVYGYFHSSCNQLHSLKGAPSIIGWTFFCDENPLVSLEGCPKKVGGSFYCNNISTKFSKSDIKAVCDVGRKIILV